MEKFQNFFSNIFLFGKSLTVPKKKLSARKTAFFHAVNIYESEGGTLRPKQSSNIAEETADHFHTYSKTLCSTGPKKKRLHLRLGKRFSLT